MTDRKTCIDFCANKDVWTAPRVHRETSAQTNLRKLSVSYVQYNLRHFSKYLHKEGCLCLFRWDRCLSTRRLNSHKIIAFTIKSWTLLNNQLRMASQTPRLCDSHIHTHTRRFRTNLMLFNFAGKLLVSWFIGVSSFDFCVYHSISYIYAIPRCNSITRGANLDSIWC